MCACVFLTCSSTLRITLLLFGFLNKSQNFYKSWCIFLLLCKTKVFALIVSFVLIHLHVSSRFQTTKTLAVITVACNKECILLNNISGILILTLFTPW